MKYFYKSAALPAIFLLLGGCGQSQDGNTRADTINDAKAKVTAVQPPFFYGTTHPFASEAIYFLMTDRFVDGDSSNNQQHQGGEYPTFDLPLESGDGRTANVGYMGGDFQGVLQQADYIRDMGFTSVWLTPIVDNPDQAFAGGEPIAFGGKFRDGGKTGYHGYWANNFYVVDEHYPSTELSFKQYTHQMREKGLKTVLDIVANHGSPSFTMPVDQPKFGELYDLQGNKVADHQNLKPSSLSADNPMHDFYRNTPDIMQLSNLDDENPAVIDYLIGSYLYWIKQGANAIRVDTIKHVPHAFWKQMSDRIRSEYPDFFMFAESFDYNANFIAQHTLDKNGDISVLDFPGQQAMSEVFENPNSDFKQLAEYLHLTHGPYNNPYELTTFYDNHDMQRMDASDEGFVDAHNWLFTSRGIPVVYYGSEMGFMRGTEEHAGNRNYLGVDNIEKAKSHTIRQALVTIANVRKQTPALQRGLQLNVELKGNKAVFYRVLQDENIAQTALVLLNKGSIPIDFNVQQYLQAGTWTNALTGDVKHIEHGDSLSTELAAHSVDVWLYEGQLAGDELLSELTLLMNHK